MKNGSCHLLKPWRCLCWVRPRVVLPQGLVGAVASGESSGSRWRRNFLFICSLPLTIPSSRTSKAGCGFNNSVMLLDSKEITLLANFISPYYLDAVSAEPACSSCLNMKFKSLKIRGDWKSLANICSGKICHHQNEGVAVYCLWY